MRGWGKRFRGYLTDCFGLDLRTLALLRIAIGVVMIRDLLWRAEDLRAHYTDFGVLPRHALLGFIDDAGFSIHLASGALWFQALMFLVHGLIAFLLIAGYRTRWMAFLNWFLLTSLCARNGAILQGGDILLRVVCFWSIFLPMGVRYSVDAALSATPAPTENRYLSVATVVYVFQILLIYIFTGLLKFAPEWRSEYSAVYFALQLDHITTPLGRWLGSQDQTFLAYLTCFTIYWERFAAFLAFFPLFRGPFRTMFVLAFIFMHWSFGTFLILGIFTWAATTAWIGLLPGWLWDQIDLRIDFTRTRCEIFYDGECGFCRRMVHLIKMFLFLRYADIKPAADSEEAAATMSETNSWVVIDPIGNVFTGYDAFVYLVNVAPLWRFFGALVDVAPARFIGDRVYAMVARNRRRASQLVFWLTPGSISVRRTWTGGILAGALFAYVLLWNIRTVNFQRFQKYLPQEYNWIGRVTGLDQYWGMFSPYPMKDDLWFVIDAKLGNGKRFSLWQGPKRISYDKPQFVENLYPTEAWRKYLTNLWDRNNEKHREFFAGWLCRSYNEHKTGKDRLHYFQFVFMVETSTLKGPMAPRREVITRWWCYDRPNDNPAPRPPVKPMFGPQLPPNFVPSPPAMSPPAGPPPVPKPVSAPVPPWPVEPAPAQR